MKTSSIMPLDPVISPWSCSLARARARARARKPCELGNVHVGIRGKSREVGLSGSLLLLFVGLLPLAAGCQPDDPPPGVRLVIDSNLTVPEFFDEIELTVTASSTDAGNICEPIMRPLDVQASGGLPLVITLERGTVYTRWVAFRVRALLTRLPEDEQEVFHREQRMLWPDSGQVEHLVFIDRSCYQPECAVSEHCVDGTCAAVPDEGVFDDPSRRDEGITCYRLEHDDGEPDAGAGDGG